MTTDTHMTAIRRRLVELGRLGARAQAVEQNILEAAAERLTQVNASLTKLSARALLDDAVAETYQRLTLERGHLEQVIARARASGAGR